MHESLALLFEKLNIIQAINLSICMIDWGTEMRRYNDKPNIVGECIFEARKKKKYTKADLHRKLELIGVELGRNEIYRIENNMMIVKDFELVALASVLDIDLNIFKDIFLDNSEENIS